MTKRGTRYVYDSGEIWRMTERQYRSYIFRNARSFNTPSQYGTLIGHASFNATRATMRDFENIEKQLRAEDREGALPKHRQGPKW